MAVPLSLSLPNLLADAVKVAPEDLFDLLAAVTVFEQLEGEGGQIGG